MLTNIIFILLAGVFIFVWRIGCSWKTEQERLQLKSSDRKGTMFAFLLFAGIPWYFAIAHPIAQFFSRGEKCSITFLVDDPSVLAVAFTVAFIFSYAAIYKTGYLAGYGEGEWQEKSRFPHFVREDLSGFPVEIRGWVEDKKEVIVGADYYWFAERRLYKITSIIERNQKYKFIVAIYEPKQETSNSRI